MAERNEIMINMSNGQSKELMATFLPPERRMLSIGLTKKRVLEIRVDSSKVSNGTLPNKLNAIHTWKKEEATTTRIFELLTYWNDKGNAYAMDINGKSMNMTRIDEEVTKGEIEVWRIRAGIYACYCVSYFFIGNCKFYKP